ncbi:hypothetical protein DFH07DRAFT_965212 [Mycena maculata]|uniref:Uncharacterized protein n=1 Tax=Mycena maculata TaxID=230809 RepID=A0AAD7N035_9AGAR|nr:hypothetical protein DFH07DRAFT_965212 [Mycena maculata]
MQNRKIHVYLISRLITGLSDLEDALDEMLHQTDNGTVLPSTQRLAPVVKDPTARDTMMPKVKTRPLRTGDPKYGGGAASGSKAAKNPKKKKSTPAQVPLPSIPAAPPANSLQSRYPLPPTSSSHLPPPHHPQSAQYQQQLYYHMFQYPNNPYLAYVTRPPSNI